MQQVSRSAYALTLFLVLCVCYGYFMPRWADWGANSRADLVYAVGDHGVLYIDDYHENTGDKACFAGRDYTGDAPCEDGHYYTDKSIGPSLVALPFYMIFKGIAALPPVQRFIDSGTGIGNLEATLNPEGAGIRPEAVYEGMALTFITFFSMSIPSAFLSVVLFLFATRFTRDLHAFILALAYGLGTIALPYSMALYQHQLAAFGTFIGFFLLWRIIYEDASLNWLWVVGILFSLVIVTEYPVVLALGVIVLWAFIRMPNRLALWRMILAGIPLGLLFAAYNFAIFETPLPVGYNYSIYWQSEHDTGFMSMTLPTLERLYGLTFSRARGIFLLSPVLLLFFPGIVMFWRQRKDQRGVTIVMALVIASFFTYNASSVMWWGGFSVGPRYLVPMLPFMMLPVVFAFDWLLSRLWGRILVGMLIAIGILSVGALTIAGQRTPYVDFEPSTFEGVDSSSPLLDYALPDLANGNVTRNYGGILLNLPGLAGLLPLIAAVLGILLGVPRLLNLKSGQLNRKSLEQAAETPH